MFSSVLFRRIFIFIQFIVLGFSGAIYFFAVPTIKQTLYQKEADASINSVNNLFDVIETQQKSIDAYWRVWAQLHMSRLKTLADIESAEMSRLQKQVSDGEMTEAQAKQAALEFTRSISKATGDFVIILDSNGKALFHPDKNLENKQLTGLKDHYGNYIYQPMIEIATQGGGYTRFYLESESQGDTPDEQFAYVEQARGWQWVMVYALDSSAIDKGIEEREKEMAQSTREVITSMQFQNVGSLFVMEADYRVIIHPDPAIEGTNLGEVIDETTKTPLGKLLRNAVFNKTDKTYVSDKTEQVMFKAKGFSGDSDKPSQMIAWVRRNTDNDWYVVAVAEQEKLFHSVELIRDRIIFTALVMLLILNIMAVLFLSRILVPVRKLSEMAARVREGDFSVQIEVEGEDEIGMLSSTFNEMVRQISDHVSNLDAKVEERTRELDQKNISLKSEVEQRIKAEQEIQHMNEVLEQTVQERTNELRQSLEDLEATQDQLVQSEKMAALGGLVAGVAHEINTPVGIGVTEASFLKEQVGKFYELYKKGTLKKSDFEKYLNNLSGSSTSILSNLERAAELITSFKQVAADQSCGERRKFKLCEYVNEILMSLQPNYKRTNHNISVDCPEGIELNSFPGAFSQIITNLVMNSLKHGFEGLDAGRAVLSFRIENDELLLKYQDNGKGMDRQTLKKLFDPFYTTKRGQGGTGLGMHIVYNLVTSTLDGVISCESEPDKGVIFSIRVPLDSE